eukprot:s1114_g10.t1
MRLQLMARRHSKACGVCRVLVWSCSLFGSKGHCLVKPPSTKELELFLGVDRVFSRTRQEQFHFDWSDTVTNRLWFSILRIGTWEKSPKSSDTKFQRYSALAGLTGDQETRNCNVSCNRNPVPVYGETSFVEPNVSFWNITKGKRQHLVLNVAVVLSLFVTLALIWRIASRIELLSKTLI